MGDSHGTTLSFHEDGKSGRLGPKPEPVLVLVLECGRPRAGSVRYRLSELTGVSIGRGPDRKAERTSNELTVRVPDRWMSSRHARIEPSFGRWVAEELSAENGAQLLVPRGFLHGFVTLTDDALVLYKVDNPYDAASDGGVRWDDPDLGIDWGLGSAAPVLSDKDGRAPAFRDWTSPFEYGATP